MDVWVVDSSVIVRQLFIGEPLAQEARRLLTRMTDTPPTQFLAPDLLYSECASALWKYVRFSGYDAQTAREHLADVRQLPLVITATTDLVDQALEIAIARGVSVYDGCYLALADRNGCTLVTAAERLIRAAANGPVAVEWLGNF